MPRVGRWSEGTTAVVADRRWRWLLLVLAVPATGAWACRCAPLSLAEYFQRADVVAQVEIVAVEAIPDGQGVRAALTLVNDYKNAAGLRAVHTAADGAQCGLRLLVGRRYWIFGALTPGSAEVVTGLCEGSRDVSQPFADTTADEAPGAIVALAAALDCETPTAVQIAARLTLTEVPADSSLVDAGQSPNAAYSLALSRPSAIQRPPRVTRLWVDRERDSRLELAMHGTTDAARAEWINEKLVLVQVPWSRQLRSDLILDVEAGEVLMVETARLDGNGKVLSWLDGRCQSPDTG